MTPLPPTHLHFEPRVHEDSGEWWFRVAISTSQIRVVSIRAAREGGDCLAAPCHLQNVRFNPRRP